MHNYFANKQSKQTNKKMSKLFDLFVLFRLHVEFSGFTSKNFASSNEQPSALLIRLISSKAIFTPQCHFIFIFRWCSLMEVNNLTGLLSWQQKASSFCFFSPLLKLIKRKNSPTACPDTETLMMSVRVADEEYVNKLIKNVNIEFIHVRNEIKHTIKVNINTPDRVLPRTVTVETTTCSLI